MNYLKLTDEFGFPVYVDRCEIIVVETLTKRVPKHGGHQYETETVPAGSRLILEHNDAVRVKELPEVIAKQLNYEV